MWLKQNPKTMADNQQIFLYSKLSYAQSSGVANLNSNLHVQYKRNARLNNATKK